LVTSPTDTAEFGIKAAEKDSGNLRATAWPKAKIFGLENIKKSCQVYCYICLLFRFAICI